MDRRPTTTQPGDAEDYQTELTQYCNGAGTGTPLCNLWQQSQNAPLSCLINFFQPGILCDPSTFLPGGKTLTAFAKELNFPPLPGEVVIQLSNLASQVVTGIVAVPYLVILIIGLVIIWLGVLFRWWDPIWGLLATLGLLIILYLFYVWQSNYLQQTVTAGLASVTDPVDAYITQVGFALLRLPRALSVGACTATGGSFSCMPTITVPTPCAENPRS
jgi:hypothetical protein